MDITTVSPKFQVVISKRIREQFGLSPGQTLQVIALPGRIELVRSQPPATSRLARFSAGQELGFPRFCGQSLKQLSR